MILLIDSYDSFTNNLRLLIAESTGEEVITIHNDTFEPEQYSDFVKSYLPLFEYIVIGPGPGHPENAKDVGIAGWLYKHYKQNPGTTLVPIFGVCLGFQSMCYEFGNRVNRLHSIRHGQVYDVIPLSDTDSSVSHKLFPTKEKTPCVRYHSLHVPMEDLTDDIVPLAYCDDVNGSTTTRVLMAGRHRSLPIYGVQYHPESVCSSSGIELVKNFHAIAKEYTHVAADSPPQLLDEIRRFDIRYREDHKFHSPEPSTDTAYYMVPISLPTAKPVAICDYLYKKSGKTDFFLLNSASNPCQWSIIGFPVLGESCVITHSTDENNIVELGKFGLPERQRLDLQALGHADIWSYLKKTFEKAYIPPATFDKHQKLPFYGGYMGLASYEEGQHIRFEKLKSMTNGSTPDLKLVHIERSLVYDHENNQWYLLSIKPDDSQWCKDMSDELLGAENDGKLVINLANIASSVKDLAEDENIEFELPDRNTYQKQFQACQEYLHSGDSYELCLTTQLKLKLPAKIHPWEIYLILTLRKNPSPYSCFMLFDDVILISSSPERFLSWQQTSGGKRKVEFRPIKGTVKKTPEVDLKAATDILRTPKEMGENLMIVDLIRHDLYLYVDKVEVSLLMSVEEYSTMFQLVSVIRGEIDHEHGIDVLECSLPPGSMTGAPKKRSVELLQDIEAMQPITNGGRRGVYSGVCGYWSVTDEAVWSVVIRSVFHYTDDKHNLDQYKLWRIGAGGAITVLSEEKGEWDEMVVKLTSALLSFT